MNYALKAGTRMLAVLVMLAAATAGAYAQQAAAAGNPATTKPDVQSAGGGYAVDNNGPVSYTHLDVYKRQIQKSGSKAFMENRLSMPRKAGATRTASAAVACAKRRPPNSRAMKPVSSTVAAPASAGLSLIHI